MRFVVALLCCATFVSPVFASKLDQLELILMHSSPVVADKPLHSTDLVRYAYQENSYDVIWQNERVVSQLLNEIEHSWQEGLNPSDYHLTVLKDYANNLDSHLGDIEFDLLLTDAVMTYATHLIRGKVNPKSLSSSWNYQLYSVTPQKAASQLLYHVKQQSIPEGLSQLKPKLPQYQKLKDLLLFFHQQPKDFRQVTLDARILKRNQTDNAVPVIRKRLEDYNLIDKVSVENERVYSADLVAGIRKLQKQNQLPADGVIGKDTLKVLNITPQQHIDTIKANLERIRWVENSLDDEFLVVNIAGYELYLYQGGELTWRTNVVVGRNYTKTPVFKGQMSYLVVNPTWTVPRSIARGIIPRVQKDISYLDKKDFMVVDSRRNPIDATTIDWQNVNRRAFPYWFVQRPSETNSLGQIKFMLPNRYSIYLHDTPAKSLFAREQRAFSHGCVRVEEPFKLAEMILNDDDNWSQKALQETLATRETTRINLAKPLDVFLMYWTVSYNHDGLHFYPDVYGRDQTLIAKLRQPL